MKYAFLDRDGTICVDTGYMRSGFELLPGAAVGMRKLRMLGYRLAVVTNQSGIGRGLINEHEYAEITMTMRQVLYREHGVVIDHVVHCPHRPEEGCGCRKPKPGLFLRIADYCAVSMRESIVIGDRQSDMDAGAAAGVGRGYLLKPEFCLYKAAQCVEQEDMGFLNTCR